MKNRKVYLDYIRIIAIVLVLFNHLPGYYLYAAPNNSIILTWSYLLITMVTRVNVPLFLMISGAVLLEKTDSNKKWGLRILRIMVVLFSLSLIMYGMYGIRTHSWQIPDFRKKFLYKFLNGKIEYLGSYWFLYAYLGMLCILPFLRYIAQKINQTDILILMILKVIFSSLLPIANFVLMCYGRDPILISANYQLPFISIKELFYPLIGFYLAENHISLKAKANCGFAAIVGIFVSSLLTYLQGSISGFTQDYVQLFDYASAIFTFILIKDFIENKEKFNLKHIVTFSGLTFGIYLFDPFWKLMGGEQLINYLCGRMPDLVASFIWILISIILGGLLTYILKKNKFISQLL